MYVEKHRLKKWVIKQLQEIVDLTQDDLIKLNVEIYSVEISFSLYTKIHTWMWKENLVTYGRNGKGGRLKGDKYTYSYNFCLTCGQKYWISNRGAAGQTSQETLEILKPKTPELNTLFWGMLKKYPEDIINVKWGYKHA